MDVERKTVGELIDELITTNVKIYHLVDAAMEGDGEAAVRAQKLNQRRNALMMAINGRLDTENIAGRVYGLGKDR